MSTNTMQITISIEITPEMVTAIERINELIYKRSLIDLTEEEIDEVDALYDIMYAAVKGQDENLVQRVIEKHIGV